MSVVSHHGVETGQPLPDRVYVDGLRDKNGMIQYMGWAVRQDDGTWQAIARVGLSLCRVELTVSFELPDHDPGDEDVRARL